MPAEKDPEKRSAPPPAEVNELLHLFVDTVEDYAIFLVDREGRMASWNPGVGRMLGFDEPEIVGQPFARIFTPEDIAAGVPARELEKAKREGRAEDNRWHLRKDGSRFWATGVLTPLWDEAGQLRGYGKVLRDNTLRKRMEEELQKQAEELKVADRRKNEFLATLSHELRNPLAPILTSLHILRRDKSENPLMQQAREVMERQLQNLVRLVDDLLDVSRIARGKVQLRKERVELNYLISRAVEAVRPQLEMREQDLTVALAPFPVWLDADATRLEQVFTNLLTNASKYTDPGGKIWLTSAREDHTALIRVRDNGVGIAPEMLPNVFNLFVQEERSLTRAQGGLGIGLSLVKSLVGLHGGSVEAQSAGLGQGSEFVVRLPVLEGTATRSSPPAPETANPARKPLQVMIVDDDPETAHNLSTLVRLYGHEVQVASSGAASLAQAALVQPDVILLDSALAGTGSFLVAQQLRQQAGQRPLKLVATTGTAKMEADVQSADAGVFDEHLIKPINPEHLRELLLRIARNPVLATSGLAGN